MLVYTLCVSILFVLSSCSEKHNNVPATVVMRGDRSYIQEYVDDVEELEKKRCNKPIITKENIDINDMKPIDAEVASDSNQKPEDKKEPLKYLIDKRNKIKEKLEALNHITKTHKVLDGFFTKTPLMIWPVDNVLEEKRYDIRGLINGNSKCADGILMYTREGESIKAVTDSKIAAVENRDGDLTYIKTDFKDIKIVYLYTGSTTRSAGDLVSQGDIIGTIKSAIATEEQPEVKGYMCFSIKKNDKTIDVKKFITKNKTIFK